MRFPHKFTQAFFLLASVALISCSEAPEAQAPQEPASPEASPITQGVNHIGFTVRDLAATTALFTDVLGWKDVGGDPSYPSEAVSDGNAYVTLWQATDPQTATPFNRKTNIGLHHFAMTVADLETLDALHTTLANHPGVTIEFAPELLGNGPTQHMMVRGPSGLRLEFIVPKGRRRADP